MLHALTRSIVGLQKGWQVTQMFFAGEPLNDQDYVLQTLPRRRENMVAELLPAPPGEDPATRLIQWDIVLRRG